VKPVHIIGVPLDLGGGRRGVDMGPSAFRVARLAEQIAELGRPVADRGNLPSPIRETERETDDRKKYVDAIAGVCANLYERVLASLNEGAVPLVLGGDHSLAAGSVAASADYVRATTGRPLGLIWVDAHGDMNTPETTTSGNVHGMPLAALLGQEPSELARIGSSPSVAAAHTVLMGIRNLDENEKAQIRASGVHVFTMKDIDRHGIASIAEQALAIAANGTGGIHVSFDLDVCDPSVTGPRRLRLPRGAHGDGAGSGLRTAGGARSRRSQPDDRHPQHDRRVRDGAGAFGAGQADSVSTGASSAGRKTRRYGGTS
jgi:arginase